MVKEVFDNYTFIFKRVIKFHLTTLLVWWMTILSLEQLMVSCVTHTWEVQTGANQQVTVDATVCKKLILRQRNMELWLAS